MEQEMSVMIQVFLADERTPTPEKWAENLWTRF
jgi:hypothetical protein